MIGFGWAMLCLWPVIAMFLYRNLSVPVALLWTLIGGYLLLPAGLGRDLPLLPALDKHSIPVLTALVLTVAVLRSVQQPVQAFDGWMPQSKIVQILLACLVLGAFGTVFTNTDVMIEGPVVLPGLRPYDAVSIIVDSAVMLIPLFLGRLIFAHPDAQRLLLKAIVISGLLYSILALWEVRMSPQLHAQIYGFFPHSFAQQVRGDGFRPVVFLGHGLAVALFFCYTVIAAAALVRASSGQERGWWMMAIVWLLGVLFLCKSYGALIITLLFLPIVLFSPGRIQLLVAFCVAVAFLLYPVLRSAGLAPVEAVIEFIHSINPERARSFQIRVEIEERLLAKANERPVFGWGSWGRPRVFEESGRSPATDGLWAINLGAGGWVRYVGFFGLFCFPILVLFFRRKQPVDPLCVGLAFILCAKLVDFIPNAGSEAFVLLCVGALIGRLEKSSWASQEDPVPDKSRASMSRYTRDFSQAHRRAASNPMDHAGERISKRFGYTRALKAESRRK